MQISTNTREVHTNGASATSNFNVARTPHMFKMLSGTLYSDKVAAAMREVVCNAIDAHTKIGETRPVVVRMPTALSPEFSVQDYGPGLSDEALRRLYTTYGWSDKQSDDAFIGGFGLGSKSPFAYGDSFTVQSVHAGVSRVYACYMDAVGVPTISRLFEGPAPEDWDHGLKVSFNVAQSDFAEFARKGKEVFRWMTPVPEVHGLSDAIEPAQFNTEGTVDNGATRYGIALKGSSDRYSASKSFVIMGGVRYPIRIDKINELGAVVAAILRAGVYLFVPIGAVLMTPSREELEYTEHTRGQLVRYVEMVAQDIAHQLLDMVLARGELSRWDWLKRIHVRLEALPYDLRDKVGELLKFAKISDSIASQVVAALNANTVACPGWVGAASDTVDVYHYSREATRRALRVVRRKVTGGTTSDRVGQALSLCVTQKVSVVYVDASRWDSRVRQELLKAESGASMLVVVPKTRLDYATAKSQAEAIAGPAGFDGLPCVPCSSFDLPDAEVPSTGAPHRAKPVAGARFVQVLRPGFGDVWRGGDESLGGLPADTTFFVVAEGSTKSYWRTFVNGEGDDCLSVSGGRYLEHFGAVAAIMGAAGIAVTAVIVVGGAGKAQQLKAIKELGIQPLFPSLVDTLRDENKAAAIRALMPQTEGVPLACARRTRNVGVLGVLAHHQHQNSAFWQKLAALIGGDHPLITCTNRAVTLWGASSENTSKLLRSLEMLECWVAQFPKELLSRVLPCKPEALEQALYKEFPLAEVLSAHVLGDLAEADADRAAACFEPLARPRVPLATALPACNDGKAQGEMDFGDEEVPRRMTA